jgi:putative Holliday junction resolvase
MKWLAVDYGDSRTGLAGCDAGETITSPITPQIEEKSMNKVAAAVTEVFAARGAEGLVCGLPKNMDGTEGSRANKSRRFAQRLANTAGVPVVLWDERRTTVSAAAILADNDTFGAKRKERLDSVSAAVIPQHNGHTRGVGQALGKAAALVGTAALGAVHVFGQTADEALGSAGGKDLGHGGGDLVHAFFFDLRRDGGGNGLPGVAPGKPGAGIAIVNGKPFHGQAPLLCYIQVL